MEDLLYKALLKNLNLRKMNLIILQLLEAVEAGADLEMHVVNQEAVLFRKNLI